MCVWVCVCWFAPHRESIDFSAGVNWLKAPVFTSQPSVCTTHWQRLLISLCHKHHGSYPSAAFSTQINGSVSTWISVCWDNTQHSQTHCCLYVSAKVPVHLRIELWLICAWKSITTVWCPAWCHVHLINSEANCQDI